MRLPPFSDGLFGGEVGKLISKAWRDWLLELLGVVNKSGGGTGTVPTGTGFRHVTSGAEDATAKLAVNADVSATAGIVESKLSLNYPTHSNANDPTASEKAALVGTYGTASSTNKYVTDTDHRMPTPQDVHGNYFQALLHQWIGSGGSGDDQVGGDYGSYGYLTISPMTAIQVPTVTQATKAKVFFKITDNMIHVLYNDGTNKDKTLAYTDDLSGYVPTSRSVLTSNGLSGGGALTSDLTLQPSYGSAVNTVCQGNDSRLSNDRTPTAHQLDSASFHIVSGLTPGNVLQALTPTTFGFAPIATIAVKQTEVNFGSTPVYEKSFTVADANIVATQKILASVSYEAPTGKTIDEVESEPLNVRAVAGTGSLTLFITALVGPVIGNFKINYMAA